MEDNSLKKLGRAELLELLLAQAKENEGLRAEIAQLKKEIANRDIAIVNAGSIAEASLNLTRVFTEAQEAATLYLDNVRKLEERQKAAMEEIVGPAMVEADQILSDAKAEAESLRSTTKADCDAMIEAAKLESEEYWTALRDRLESLYEAHEGMRELSKLYHL